MSTEKTRTQKNPHPFRKTLKKGLYWGILLVLLVFGSLWRKGGYQWMSTPVVLSPQSSDELIEISPNASFVIEFDQLMKKETVSKNLIVDPRIELEEQWRGKQLILIPNALLKKGSRYEITLGKEAENVFGYSLDHNFTFSYQVGEEARILAIHPAENIQAADSLTVFFSHPMIPDHAIGSPDLQGLFILSPALSGDWVWKNTKTLSFKPRDGFPFSSEFRLNNRMPLKTLNNSLINDEVDQVYKTATIKLLEKEADEDSKVYSVEQPFVLSFNQPVSVSSLKEKLEVRREDGSTVSSLFIIKDESSGGSYQVLPQGMKWSYQHKYSVALAEGLLPDRGNSPLTVGKEWTFQTEPLVVINPRIDSEGNYYFADSTFVLMLKETIPFETLKESLGTLSGIETSIRKIDQNTFRIAIIQNSQKRENIDFIISKTINPRGRDYLQNDLIFRVSQSPSIKSVTRDARQSICIHLNQVLDEEFSQAIWKDDDNEKKEALRPSNKQDCEEVEGFPYAYQVPKSIIPPDSTHEISLELRDIFGNILEQNLEVTRPQLTSDDFELFQNQSQFFQTVSSAEELLFSYSHKNLSDLQIKVCQLSFSQFFSVEYNREERWTGFFPSPSNCTRIKTLQKESEISWDETITSTVDILEATPESTDGLFYVQVLSPSASRQYGFSERAHGILQYSPLEVISKRGQNSLIWVLDKESLIPVENAQVTYYNSDGVAVLSSTTSEKGLLLDTKIKLKYDYLTARKGNKEVLLYAFDQAGLEPWRYGAPFNFDENPYLFQVLFESEQGISPGREGVVLLKQKNERSAQAPNVSSVVLTLENLSGDILWRKIAPVDDYGNIPFQIENIVPLGREKLVFGICIGLQDSICQGTFLSTPLDFEEVSQQTKKTTPEETEQPQVAHRHLRITKSPLADVGETISLQLSNLERDYPVLITAESDHISYAEVFVAAASEEEVVIELNEEMIPEVFFSVSQFTDKGMLYDMDGIWIGHQSRTIDLSQLKTADSFEEFALQTLRGKKIEDPSILVFKKYDRMPFAFPNFLEKYYPKMGNSVLTASTRTQESPDQGQQMSTMALETSTHLLLFPGEISLLNTDEVNQQQDQSRVPSDIYYLVHDKQGHMGMISQQRSVPLKSEVLLEDFSITTGQLSFLRPTDQLTIDLTLTNKTDFSRNLLFEMESTDILTEPQQPVFLGLSANDSRILPITISLPLQRNASTLPGVLMNLKADSRSLAQQTLVLKRTEAIRYLPNRTHTWSQLETGQGELLIPSSQATSLQRLYTVSTSPIAYVIGNLSEYMKRDTLWTEEIIQRAALLALFKDLMPAENDHQQDLIALVQETEPIENVLEYLQYAQREDGGWNEMPTGLDSDVLFTISIAEKLSDIEQHSESRLDVGMRKKLVSYLKIRLQEQGADRITKETKLSSLSDTEALTELRHIRSISALSPSGIPFANNWYNIREELSDHALVTLLLIYEDYRDAQVSGSSFKIEELTQLLKERRDRFKNTIWISSLQPASDFAATSLYLQALVRQASSHLDIPEVISWLNDNKYKRQYQSRDNQYLFLKAMASYLRLFQEQNLSDKISLQFSENSTVDFQRDKEVSGQFFQSSKQFQIEQGDDQLQDIRVLVSSTPKQPLFIEASWEIEDKIPDAQGISIFTDYPDGLKTTRGELIAGEISILTPFPRKKMILIQHIPSLIHSTVSQSDISSLETRQYGEDQIWYIIDQLPAGKSTISFEWTAQFAGTALIPPLEIFSAVEPDVYATSLERKLEVR